MAFKDFQAADVLTAQEIDEYLMRQTVIVFDSAAARNLAIASPTEGMTVFLKDSNELQVHDGSTWVGVKSSTLTATGNISSLGGNISASGSVSSNSVSTGTIDASGSIRANNTGADGGVILRPWTANPTGWTSVATQGMAGAEYMMVSDGSNTFVSSGIGGQVGIRAPINDSNNQVVVSSAGVFMNGRVHMSTQPYMQASGTGGWVAPQNSPLRTGVPSGFDWSVSINTGGHFSSASGQFIAPVSGVYLCMFQTYYLTGGTAGYYTHFLWNVGGGAAWNSGRTPYNIYGYGGDYYADGVSANHMIYVNAGNGIAMHAPSGGSPLFYGDYTYMSIRLLG